MQNDQSYNKKYGYKETTTVTSSINLTNENIVIRRAETTAMVMKLKLNWIPIQESIG